MRINCVSFDLSECLVTSCRYLAFVKVREIIREIEEDGWVGVRQTGSHRHFRHPSKPGTVTVPSQMGDELAKGTVGNIGKRDYLGGGDDGVRNCD